MTRPEKAVISMPGAATAGPADPEWSRFARSSGRDRSRQVSTHADGLDVVVWDRDHLVFLDRRPRSVSVARLDVRAYFMSMQPGLPAVARR